MKQRRPIHREGHRLTLLRRGFAGQAPAATFQMLAAGLLVLAAAGCGREAPPAVQPATPPPPRVETVTSGPLNITVTVDPPVVRFDRDQILTLQVNAPAEVSIDIPPVDSRMQGFALSGQFSTEPVTRDGRVTREYKFRLTPHAAETFRIAPFPVMYTDHGQNPPFSGWLATPAIRLELQLPDGVAPQDDIAPAPRPVWVYPGWRGTLRGLGWLAGAAVLLVLLARLFRRAKEEIRIRRMSPRERALHELDRLLSRDLVRQHRVKDFYVELTMIVRRYIERAHRVRAPEQTTQEFLQAVASDTRFDPATVERLRAFLEAADLVKFAAFEPTDDAVDQATRTARDYIQTDPGEIGEGEDR